MTTMVEKVARDLIEALRGSYAFLVCLSASFFMVVAWQSDHVVSQVVFFVVGMLGFVWALDLAETKGRERAAAKYADMFLSFALWTEDKEIIITHRKGGAE